MALIIIIIILIILVAILLNVIVGTNMINTAVTGADNYVGTGEVENNMTEESPKDDSDSEIIDEEKVELIGKYVAYTPDEGTYATVTGNTTYTGTANNTEDFTTDTSLNWQIWSITDDTLILIADDVADSGGYYYSSYGYYMLYLLGNLGYNNGVKILNDICETCYSNSSLGATGRSLNIQDIEEVLDWRIWAPSSFSTPYGQTYTSRYQYTDCRCYPGLWSQEDYSNIDDVIVNNASYTYDSTTGKLTYIGEGLRRSEQTVFCTDSYGEADSYIYPTQTYWYAEASTLTNAWTDSKYASLLNINKNFWLSSRFTNLVSRFDVEFGVQVMNDEGCINGNYLYETEGFYWGRGSGIRPVVSISLSSVWIDTDSTTGEIASEAYQLIAK